MFPIMAFKGFGDYMKAKHGKLFDQAMEIAQDSESRIFDGMIFYLNGYTPNIKEPALLNGAMVQDYLNSKVTHIIASEDLDLDDPKVQVVVCTADGFIKRYFETSRLHYLSTWKSSLVDDVIKQMSKKSSYVPPKNPILMHIDMDCFFVAVALRNQQELNQKPVVIAHSVQSTNFSSTSEIASSNYVARERGIKNGSNLGRAKELAPDLIVLPYDFEGPLIMLTYKAVSCDEALIDCSSQIFHEEGMNEPSNETVLGFARNLKKRIFTETNGCSVSIGIGFNPLTARLATHKAKPNGIFRITQAIVDEHMLTIPIGNLPGVGRTFIDKFNEMNVITCGDAQRISLQKLTKVFGEKNGRSLYSFCRGHDTRVLINKPRQSIGAEINWAVRFKDVPQQNKFILDLCNEVLDRVSATGIHFQHLTVNAKKRDYKGEPWKYLGCGHCINYSKSTMLDSFANQSNLYPAVLKLFLEFQIPVQDVRGIGIHLKAQNVVGSGQRKINFFPKKRKDDIVENSSDVEVITDIPLKSKRRCSDIIKQKKELEDFHLRPSASQIDASILACLPKSIRKEQERLATNRPSSVMKGKKKPNLERKRDIIPTLGGLTDSNLIWNRIQDWLSSAKGGNEPTLVDIESISLYLCALVSNWEMERCQKILKAIRKSISTREKDSHLQHWDNAYGKILKRVGDITQDLYGSRIIM
ncbi:deoxycytidyl transferase [Globomyces sp. JEL0801]|nr:deoxycytidyl transferase [Globomyces sp. JEL0801]